MINTNSIAHYLNPKGIRITVADVSDAAAKIQEIHQLPELTASIMGKILAGTAALATDFKNHEGGSLQWKTNSVLGTIHTDAYEGSYVRGFVDHADEGLDITEENEKNLVSAAGAKLTVTRYSLLKMPYNSTVLLTDGNISQCFTQYIEQSDQTLSFVGTEAKISPEGKIIRAAAYIAHLLPEGDKESFLSVLKEGPYFIFTDDSDKSIHSLLESKEFALLTSSPVSFRCTCSEERIKNSLMSLPEVEKQKLSEDENIEIFCHYCGKSYKIFRDTFKSWLSNEGGHIQ